MNHVGKDDGKQSTKSEGKQPTKKVVYFQDCFFEGINKAKKGNDDDEEIMEPSEIFFELANAPYVGFKVDYRSVGKSNEDKITVNDDTTKDKTERIPAVIIKQDNDCQSHTGGIVWETSYLLALYLKSKYGEERSEDSTQKKNLDSPLPLGRLLEVGSGCGMLGLIMASSNLCKKVVMTETVDVMPNLITNLNYNISSEGFCSSDIVSAGQLRWDAYKEDIKINDDLQAHSFDSIIGTDVIFSTSLVKPLLSTLRKMAHDGTNVYLCVQVRCADSHALFLKKTAKYGFVCNDITEELKSIDACKFGLELDCKLFLLTRSKEKKRRDDGTTSGDKFRRNKRLRT